MGETAIVCITVVILLHHVKRDGVVGIHPMKMGPTSNFATTTGIEK